MFRTFVARTTQINSNKIIKKNKNNLNKEIKKKIKNNDNIIKKYNTNNFNLTDEKIKEANKNIFLL